MKIHFENVGAHHKTWTEETESLSDAVMYAIIRKAHCIASREFEIAWNDGGTSGKILVGMFRTAGTFTVEGGAKILTEDDIILEAQC